MIDLDFESYCESIEAEFFRRKGRRGMLSPTDFARTKTWYDAGVALEEVFDGIASAFDTHAQGRHRDGEDVNSLAFCESFVERAVSSRRGGVS